MGDKTELGVESERIRLAYGNLRNTFITVPLAVLAVVFVELTDAANPGPLVVWGALILASLVPRYYFYREFKKTAGAGPDRGFWARKYLTGTMLGGLAWGLTPLVLFPDNSAEHRIFITLVIGGMAAGASFAYAPMLLPARVFISLSLVPLVLAHIVIGGGVSYGVAFMTSLFYLMLMVSLKGNNGFIDESIRLGQENSGLVRRLSAEKEKAESAATLLREEVRERASAEERLTRAQKVAHVGNWNWDIRHNRFSMSEETCHILGLAYADCQMTYENLIRAVPQKEAGAVKRAVYEAIFELKRLNIEHTVALEDGTVRAVHQLAEVIYDENGEPAEIEGTIQDVTERKAAEARLRDSEERFRSLIGSMQDAVFVLDRDQRFTDVFGKWLEREGISPEEFIGRTYREMFGREVGEIHQQATEKALGGQAVTFQWSLEWQDNRDFYQTSLSPLIAEDGKISGVVGVNRDITVLKNKEEELQAAKQKAEEATKVKDKFISIVAHDIRGPFGTVLELLKLIQKDEANPMHKNHKTVIERVLATGKGMLEMFEELLNIGRLQTGSLEIHLRFIDARSAVASAVEKLQPLSESKGVTIKNDVPLKTRIFADVSLSVTVFQNLVSNAIKFSKQGQEIRIFAPEGRPGVVAVQDGGTGVSPKILPDLFKPDVKTTTVGTGGERGSGFGLPFCQEIMRAHGGKIEVESVIGAGSVFYIEFPPVRPRILIVDDEESIRAMLTKYLGALDVSILEANNGESAMRLILDNDPHLVIADIKMPGVGGFDLLEKVQKDKKRRLVPFIMITGDQTPGVNEKVFQLGGSDFIRKPFSREEFTARVKRFIG